MSVRFYKLKPGDKFTSTSGAVYVKLSGVTVDGQVYNARKLSRAGKTCTLATFDSDKEVDYVEEKKTFADIKHGAYFIHDGLKYVKLHLAYETDYDTVNSIKCNDRRAFFFKPEYEVEECEA